MKNSGKVILGFIGVMAIIAIIFLVSVYGFGSLQRGTADFRGETDKIEQTQADGSYRIAQYEHFYDLCASVISIESKITNMSDELEALTDDKQRETVLNTSITASKNKRAELISQYNADARKEGTMAQFKSSELPYSLDENEEETICDIQ